MVLRDRICGDSDGSANGRATQRQTLAARQSRGVALLLVASLLLLASLLSPEADQTGNATGISATTSSIR